MFSAALVDLFICLSFFLSVRLSVCLLPRLLSDIVIDHPAILCEDVNCDDPSHASAI